MGHPYIRSKLAGRYTPRSTPSGFLCNVHHIEAIAKDGGSPITILGTVGGDRLRIKIGEQEVVNSRVAEMEAVWRSSIRLKLHAEAIAAGAE